MIVLRVTVRVKDLDGFITRYARHLAGDRIFIFTKSPQPVGTRVRFSMHLADGEAVIHGKGTVTRVQSTVDDAHRPPGMELVFVPLDDRSQTIVDFMHAARLGGVEKLPPVVRAVLPSSPLLPPPSPTPSPPAKAASAQVVPNVPVPLPPAPRRPMVKISERIGAGLAGADPTPLPISIKEPAPLLSAAPQAAPLSPQGEEAQGDPSAPQTAASEPAETGEPSETLPAEGPAPPPDAAGRSEEINELLAQMLGPRAHLAAEPVAPGPAPLMAEGWRGGAEGLEAPLGQDLPANPFSDVSDGAIEYFVEWSLEQSIGPRAEKTSEFSNVPMALPTAAEQAVPPTGLARLPPWALAAAGFVVGAPMGALLLWALSGPGKSEPPPSQAVVAAATAPGPAEGSSAAPQPKEAPAPVEEEEPAPAAAAQAPEAAAEAPATGKLEIVTRPPGAQLTVDGKAVGQSPKSLDLAPGPHKVTASKDRYAALSEEVTAPGTAELTLKRPPLELVVRSTPTGAEVVVGGVSRGRTPLTVTLPGYEHYDVRVSASGSSSWRRAVYLKEPSTTLQAVLSKRKASKPTRRSTSPAALPERRIGIR